MSRSLRVALLFAVPFCVHAQAPAAPGAITIGRTDTLWSATLKEKRPYLVYTPPSYRDTTYLPRAYPVLYLLDGDAHFHSVTGLLQILGTGVNGTFVVPEMIVVAIPNTNRMRDMTPTHATRGPDNSPTPAFGASGGMTNFLGFIKTELIPHIDSAYRTAPYRVFVGHSLGGITTIQALYTIPETFNAYVAIDPSLWWDDRLLLRRAKEAFSRPAPAGRSLFVAQANTISPDDTTANIHYASIVQFNSILEAYNRSGVRYAYKYYAGDDHGSVPMIAEYDALHFIFDGYKSNLLMSLDRPAYIAEHFTHVSALLGYQVKPPESMVDMLGQIELSRDSTKALALLAMNAELYPTSPHALVALGDLQLARRDSASARTTFGRAIALKPGHQRAIDGLRKAQGSSK
ncbi:MAG: alpha/beta hydrolase-fold protein [Gemmatimonadaceae bacterium]